jgi:spoIIIJ-associated protein
MIERTTLEKIAPTVDEAVAQGLAELNLPAEMVDVEVLDTGSRGMLGIGGRQARVRLTVKGTTPPVPVEQPASPEPDNLKQDETLGLTQQVVSDLLELMKVTAFVDVHYGEPNEQGEEPVCVEIRGDDLGVLIGRRAEILNALQYIVNLIMSKQAGRWLQVTIDVEGYRARREHQLQQMAQRMADQAMKTGRRQSLEPMPANERRIVHLELRDHPSVTTQSVGEEPARKVTIVPK